MKIKSMVKYGIPLFLIYWVAIGVLYEYNGPHENLTNAHHYIWVEYDRPNVARHIIDRYKGDPETLKVYEFPISNYLFNRYKYIGLEFGN